MGFNYPHPHPLSQWERGENRKPWFTRKWGEGYFSLCLLLTTFCLLLSSAVFAETVTIDRVEASRDRGFDYLDIYTSGWSNAKGLLLEDKLYLDFPGAKINPKIAIELVKSKRIQNIQAAQKDPDTARIIITLKKESDYEIVNVFGRNKSVVEISDRITSVYQQLAWETGSVKQKGQPLKTVKLPPVVSKKILSLRGKAIILDPGHGGEDPGALTSDGMPEKSLTLRLAQRTAHLLREAGATVYLTRNEDRRSNLHDIVDFANRSEADIFLSIHYNSSYSSNISGTETYFYNPRSRALAQKMHAAIINGIKRKDHGLNRVPFFVIKNTEIPSVLLEPIYISNGEESYLARSSSFQEKLAEDIVKGVKEYFRSKRR